MTSRERINTVLKGKIPDRVPCCEISFWPATRERWLAEGLPKDADIAEYLGLDRLGAIGWRQGFGLEKQVRSDEDFIIDVDGFGTTWQRRKNAEGQAEGNVTPVAIDHPVKRKEDWFVLKDRLKVEQARISEDTKQAYRNLKDRGAFVFINPGEPMWNVLEHLLGFERALPWLLEEPEVVRDMLRTLTDFTFGMSEECAGMFQIDAIWFFADLCYKNGMLFSPKVYREIVMPFHREFADFCRAKGWSLIMHCDGDVRQFIPLLIEAGFNCIQPLEARAGNDVRELKKTYGKQITFFGNISAETLSSTRERIEEEVRTKVTVAKENGGYIYHSDHSVPPTVSLADYRYALDLARRYGKY